ncbi:PepSY-associated TM helix domain-containing protein [Sphingosinicella sp. LHD-64]|uniref:PepSY-associated TM helix domain-containing protein n=1 Tax=Sphingosinicella sp. LHD-64 TaxID=3072139 RepID=UPI00280F86BE|nr:PepSY-associated TM helix domain-containing protein [Sphingosinicella sp. LHD-64]MDQ8756579.1 PepSY-associated TM helix domain-containing protein [Sphingosinicella sp. LHD-64]
MAQSTTLRLRGWWLWVHKWIGILLAVLIIPISVTGSALVWHDWLDETLNPQRVVTGTPALTPSAYADAARTALAPGERVMSVRYPEGEGAVLVQAARPPQPGAGGRPVRTNVWLDPADGRVLDTAGSNAGAVRVLHVLHGSMMIPGGWGRPIVGWVGIFMFVSCLTGIWLWWPITGSVKRGFRWKRQNSLNANLHHQMGFWILVPLAMLSFTGFWISFPSVFGVFESSQPRAEGKAKGGGREGREGRGKGAEKGGAPDRMRAMRAQPLERTALTPEAALAAAQPHATGPLVLVTWPTDQEESWKVSFARAGGPAEISVADASGEVTPPRPPRPETNARLMRRWHDGTGMGVVWQIVIFIGGIIPALLSITGLVMWWRSRGWKAELAKKRKARAKAGQAVPQPAE